MIHKSQSLNARASSPVYVFAGVVPGSDWFIHIFPTLLFHRLVLKAFFYWHFQFLPIHSRAVAVCLASLHLWMPLKRNHSRRTSTTRTFGGSSTWSSWVRRGWTDGITTMLLMMMAHSSLGSDNQWLGRGGVSVIGFYDAPFPMFFTLLSLVSAKHGGWVVNGCAICDSMLQKPPNIRGWWIYLLLELISSRDWGNPSEYVNRYSVHVNIN